MASVTEMPSLKMPGREASVEEWQAIVDRLRSQQMLRAIEHGEGPQYYELADGQRVPIMAGGSVTATWTDPTGATLDLLTGQTATQTWTEAIASNLDYLLGTDGATPTAGLVVRAADNKLGGSATNITLSGISQSFKHLRLMFSGRGDTAAALDSIRVQFNGDTGANYNYSYVQNFNTTVTGVSTVGQVSALVSDLPAASAAASVTGGLTLDIADYASTTLFKTLTGNSGSADNTAANCAVLIVQALWRSTAAITSIKLFCGASTNLVTGTRVTAYVEN